MNVDINPMAEMVKTMIYSLIPIILNTFLPIFGIKMAIEIGIKLVKKAILVHSINDELEENDHGRDVSFFD